ncbi:glycosyltransferase family 2 protein [Candidatus Gottesmanbacteria bacterium]|nr:glycosyltransferase family 2 protein [Candidatus Gottesmanbacteria bacterium]
MKRISVVISARNEEGKLNRCLSSVAWADEVIVVDNESTDESVSIARRHNATVYPRQNNLMLNVNKNFGFEKAQGNWILSLDADEEVTPELVKEIQRQIQNPKSKIQNIVGYWIPRKNIIFGKWMQHGLWWPDKQLRLFKRGKGRFPCVHVHEYLEVDGRTDELREPYIHYNYETISQFIRKMDTIYTESEVQKLMTTNYQLAWYDALRFPVSDFVKVFFAQVGFKDGLHGLVLAMLQGFYSFIVFAKLWERRKFQEQQVSLESLTEEMNRNVHDIRYWMFTAHMRNSPSMLKKVWWKVFRRYAS